MYSAAVCVVEEGRANQLPRPPRYPTLVTDLEAAWAAVHEHTPEGWWDHTFNGLPLLTTGRRCPRR